MNISLSPLFQHRLSLLIRQLHIWLYAITCVKKVVSSFLELLTSFTFLSCHSTITVDLTASTVTTVAGWMRPGVHTNRQSTRYRSHYLLLSPLLPNNTNYHHYNWCLRSGQWVVRTGWAPFQVLHCGEIKTQPLTVFIKPNPQFFHFVLLVHAFTAQQQKQTYQSIKTYHQRF